MTAGCDIGLVGLAVMGQNLVLNLESRGFAVAVHNRTAAVTEAFVAAHPGRRITGAPTLAALVAALKRPRRVLLMVQAGAAVDAVLAELAPLLEDGDIVVDGGNSLFTDTERREAKLAARGLHFVGAGISGGEEGARKGPSIMPGGPAAAWPTLRPLFEAIAARVDGEPCVVHIGPGGSGHYVKMVHNGIEYGDMQLIAEAYAIFGAAGMTADAMADVFDAWNQGEQQSYLVHITGKALRERDPETGQPVVDLIVDRAGQKGTGRWTLIDAAERAVVVSTINAAVEARVLSSRKAEREVASGLLEGPVPRIEMPHEALVAMVHDALYASKIVSYAQGLALLRAAGDAKGWQLDLGAIASVWRGGCIIRARFLNRIADAYRAEPGLGNLMLAPFFRERLARCQQRWRETVALAVGQGLPVPAMSASLAYFDSLRSARLPANLLQAQRDFFGAHGFERVDRPAGALFHHRWPEVV